MLHHRSVSPGDSVDLPRLDLDGEVVAYPNLSNAIVVYTSLGGWLAGWRARYEASRPDRILFPVGSEPDVIVAWDRVSVERIHDHRSFGVLVYRFTHPRFEAPSYLTPSTQQRLLVCDAAVERQTPEARRVVKLGRPSKEESPGQRSLFDDNS